MNITNETGIYLITNKINNKKYVGSTHNFKIRWRSHISMLNRKVHFNSHLLNSWNKYGLKNFEFSILEIIDNSLDNLEDLLITRELYFIEKLNTIKNGYNTRKDCNTNLGLKWPEESKLKFSKYRKTHIVKEAVEALNKYAKTRIGKRNHYYTEWYNSLSAFAKEDFNKRRIDSRKTSSKNRGFWISENSINKILTTKKKKGLIKSISLYNIDGTLYKTYESYADCLREFNDTIKNSSKLVNCERTGKLFNGYIVSYSSSQFLENYNEIVEKVNKCLSNINYGKYKEGKLISLYKTKALIINEIGITAFNKYFSKLLKTPVIYNKYYWKLIEPISSDIYRKLGEFSETPVMDNTEPSSGLTTTEGATTNS